MGLGVETYDISDYSPASCSVLKNSIKNKKGKVKKWTEKNTLETVQVTQNKSLILLREGNK